MFEEVFLSTYESIHYCLLDLHGQRAISSGKIAGKVLRNKSDKALAKKQVVPIYSCFFFFSSLLRIRFNCMLRDGEGWVCWDC